MKTVTQDQLQKFVNNEILANQSALIEMLNGKGIFESEQLENGEYLPCPNCNYELHPSNDYKKYYCRDCETWLTGKEAQDIESEYKEIFEWYLVTDFLAEKLDKLNEPMLKTDYGTWWGRTCTGQAIILDSVIETIYLSLAYPTK